MKVLYLLNRVQGDRIEHIKRGEDNDDHLYGLLRLPDQGIETWYLEIEQYLPKWFASFLRKHVLNIYWVHLPFFSKFFAYDVVFTSTAFGSQLLHAFYPFKKPAWIMLDFSLTGFMGEGNTLKQKLFNVIVSRAAGIVTLDEHEKVELENRFPVLRDRIVFIRFAVDTVFFNPRHSVPEENLIFSPGRDPGRDFSTLFQAVEGVDTHVLLTARPHNIKKLLPLPTAVTNADFTIEEYRATFARASVVVIPLDTRNGINNAMGTSTLVEAMAMGKAIVATRTWTTESYITDGVNGVLVSPRDPAALRAALVALLYDPERRQRLGASARAFAEAECSAERFATSLATYLKSVAK